MKVLTLTQPWATLAAIGAKKIETRSWMTNYRGALAIHAAKGLEPVGGKRGLVEQCARKYFLPALDAIMPEHLQGILSPGSIADHLPLGAIVAVCNLVDCKIIGVPPSGIPEILHEDNMSFVPILGQERAFGDYSPGRYAWLLADVRALPEPIPAKGALGLWEWDGKLSL